MNRGDVQVDLSAVKNTDEETRPSGSGSRGRGRSSCNARDAQDPPHRLAFQAEAAANPTFASQLEEAGRRAVWTDGTEGPGHGTWRREEQGVSESALRGQASRSQGRAQRGALPGRSPDRVRGRSGDLPRVSAFCPGHWGLLWAGQGGQQHPDPPDAPCSKVQNQCSTVPYGGDRVQEGRVEGGDQQGGREGP